VFLLPKHCYPSLPLVPEPPITLCFSFFVLTGVKAGVERSELCTEMWKFIWKCGNLLPQDSNFEISSMRFRDISSEGRLARLLAFTSKRGAVKVKSW